MSPYSILGEYGFYLLGSCDDLPRAAAIVRADSGSTLIAAAGSTRVIWVNYPWKGKTVLCRGGVMTFYSFTSPGPLTDDEWRKRLHASPPPEPPDWLEPLGLMPVNAPKEN